MQESELPADVQKFLRARIASYEQLELLSIMRADQSASWTAETLCERLRATSSPLQDALEGLRSGGLVAARIEGNEKHYVYVPQTDDVEATISRLVAAYREYPIPIIKLMSANAIERLRTAALRTFADAFIVRKD